MLSMGSAGERQVMSVALQTRSGKWPETEAEENVIFHPRQLTPDTRAVVSISPLSTDHHHRLPHPTCTPLSHVRPHPRLARPFQRQPAPPSSGATWASSIRSKRRPPRYVSRSGSCARLPSVGGRVQGENTKGRGAAERGGGGQSSSTEDELHAPTLNTYLRLYRLTRCFFSHDGL